MNHHVARALFLTTVALLSTETVVAQVGTYTLWFCLERCDESNRDELAVTRAELILDAAPLDLTSIQESKAEVLALADANQKTANGCITTHINEGDEFNPGIDWFSLVEWRSSSETTITIEAPQDPPGYTLALWFGDEIGGIGRSRHNPMFVSGSALQDQNRASCPELAAVFEKP